MAETLADLMRQVGIEDSNRARRGEYTPGPYRRGYRPGAEIAPYYPARRVPTEADRDTMRAVDRMQPAQSEPLGHSRLEQMGRDAFEVTGLPSFRRAGRAFASGDPVGGAGEAAMGTLGLTGVAELGRVGLAALGPRAAVRTPPRQPMRNVTPPAEAPTADNWFDVYHGTNRAVEGQFRRSGSGALGPGFYVGRRPQTTEVFAGTPRGVDRDGQLNVQFGEGSQILPLQARGRMATPQQWEDALATAQERMGRYAYRESSDVQRAAADDLAARGFAGVEDPERDFINMFDPNANVRSRFQRPPLPMDEASRMGRAAPMVGGTPEARQRAIEQGFDVDTPLYHGTAERDFSGFKPSEQGLDGPGIYLTRDPHIASEYAGDWSDEAARVVHPERARVMPVFARNARSAPIAGRGTVVVENPADVRSRFAAFDPSRSGESDLLAAPQRNIPPPGSRGSPPPQPPQGGFFNARVPAMQQRQPRVTEGQAPNWPPNADSVLADTSLPRQTVDFRPERGYRRDQTVQMYVNPTRDDIARATRVPMHDRERPFIYNNMRWIRDGQGNVFMVNGYDVVHDDIARLMDKRGWLPEGWAYEDALDRMRSTPQPTGVSKGSLLRRPDGTYQIGGAGPDGRNATEDTLFPMRERRQ